MLGPDHPDVAISLNDLANLYQRQSRYADAEMLYKRSLAISERALGPDHPDVAASLNNLAMLYKDRGRLPDAEQLIKESLAITEKGLGSNHPDLAVTLVNLGLVYENAFARRYSQPRSPNAERSTPGGAYHPVEP